MCYEENRKFYCLCGCEKEVKPGKKFVHGHHRRGQKLSEETKRKLSVVHTGSHHSEETKSKISIASSGKDHSGENNPHFGKKHSEETKAKISIANSGEKHPLWQGGIQHEPYGLGNDEELKEQIRIRDNYTCQECGVIWDGIEKKFHPHHIDYDKNNHIPWNRITLCRSCHSKTNTNREYWMKHFYEINFNNCIQRFL